MSKKLTIQIVGWNSAEHLRAAVRALSDVPDDAATIRYIDNGSSDNSVEVVRHALVQADIVELPENKGFAGGHNVGFLKCNTEYVLTHDPDVQLQWKGLQELLEYMNAHEDVGAVQGKLLRSKFSKYSGGRIIDSAGIELTLTLNGRERGANQEDIGQFDDESEIIATTGACSLYRMKALREVQSSDGEIYDEDFFAYKEDIDLGWRLQRAGWKSMYVPVTVGTHARSLGKRGFMNWGLNPLRVYMRLASSRTRYSLRNYVWTLLKNVSWQQWLWHGIFVGLRLGVFLLLSLLYLPLLKTWVEIFRELPHMLHKRRM